MEALYHGRREEADRLLSEMGTDALTIHEAAAMGVVPRLEQLLAQDAAAVNSFAPDGFQPLGLAAFFGRHEAAELLLQRGGEVNTASHNAQGVNALHAALSSADPEFARSLIAAGADVNAPQASGVTPLHETAFNGYLELTRVLLEHGANPSVRDASGKTPADFAREHGHTAVAEILEKT
jgi:ankyrin repeat protein